MEPSGFKASVRNWQDGPRLVSESQGVLPGTLAREGCAVIPIFSRRLQDHWIRTDRQQPPATGAQHSLSVTLRMSNKWIQGAGHPPNSLASSENH